VLLLLAASHPVTFWDAVVAFFTEPKAWIPAALSVVAIVVSVFTASQTWRYYPKPLIVAEAKRSRGKWQPIQESKMLGGPFVAARLVNRGNGIAYDVRVKVSARGQVPLETSNGGKDLEPGKAERYSVEWGTSIPISNTNSDAGWTVEQVDVKRVRYVVRWRQAPTMTRWRSTRIRFEDSAEEHDTNVW
jgi:hypothetical protein